MTQQMRSHRRNHFCAPLWFRLQFITSATSAALHRHSERASFSITQQLVAFSGSGDRVQAPPSICLLSPPVTREKSCSKSQPSTPCVRFCLELRRLLYKCTLYLWSLPIKSA